MNEIRDDGAIVIGNALKNNEKLTKLSLSNIRFIINR
jgi:hypothetical protein